jgi:peptide/nickel transport system permease protein
VITRGAAAAIGAPLLTDFSPSQLSIVNRLKPPGGGHLMGTDDLGRDIFTRVLYAGRTSLMVGLSVVAIASLIGICLGLVAGFFRRADAPVSRLIDAMMAFPDILLAIALVAALGPSAINVVLALGIVYAPRLARVVRASTLVIRELPYVEAARALGVRTPVILVRHVLRNVTSPLLVQATFIFAQAILAEAGLSFLGVGVSGSVPMSSGLPPSIGAKLPCCSWLCAMASAYMMRSGSAARMRDEVLRVVAHDLRSPLHAIGMSASVLLDDVPPQERERYEKAIAIIQPLVEQAQREPAPEQTQQAAAGPAT